MKFSQIAGLQGPTGVSVPDATNHEGHRAFSETIKLKIARLALTGVLGNTFYTDENAQTKDMVDVLKEAVAADPAFLFKAAKVSRRANFKLFPKLAIAALISELSRPSSLVTVPKVFTWTPEMENDIVGVLSTYNAGQLVELAMVFKNKVFGGGLGRRAQRVMGRALASIKPDRLETMTLSDRDDLRRLLRLLHPDKLSTEQAALLPYVLSDDRKAVTPRQLALEALKECKDDAAAAKLITENALPFNVTKGMVSGDRKDAWKAILGEMSTLQVLLNAASLHEKGILDPADLALYLSAVDIDKTRLVPHDVLRPIAHAPAVYQNAFIDFLAKLASRPLPGLEDKAVGISLDFSGSMAGNVGASAWSLAVTMASPIIASSPDRYLSFFGNHAWMEGEKTEAGYNSPGVMPNLKGMEPAQVFKALLGLHPCFGTNLGSAVKLFTDRRIWLDVLFLFTDEQQNGNVRCLEAWRSYRTHVNKDAKLVVVNVSNTKWHSVQDGTEGVTVIQAITPLVYDQFQSFGESGVEMIERLG